MEKSSFKVGDLVEWESTSFGVTTPKKGRIVKVIPPNDSRLGEYVEQASAAVGGARYVSGAGLGLPRDHESYIVHVLTPTGKGKGKLYWPRVKHLRKVETEGK